jgi:transcriptional regulator with XRE-family HTH domain
MRKYEDLTTHNDDAKGFAPQGDTELGRKLSSLRIRAGLTQTDIARKVAVSRQHISNIERGVASPTVRVLQAYLQVCGINLAEFFYGPLPINQTRRHREYHGKLQTLLENDKTSSVVTKVLDSFMTSLQASLAAVIQPIRVQMRQPRAQRKNDEGG